jgi:hypothetical protein
MEAMAVIWKPEFPHRRHHEVLTKDINFCNESVLLRTYYKPEALKILFPNYKSHKSNDCGLFENTQISIFQLI